MIIVRRPYGADGDRVTVPLFAITSDELDQTAIVASTASQGTYTLAANVSNNNTVDIDEVIAGSLVAKRYTWKTTLTASTTENEVLIDGTNASNSIDNLIAAIMGTGTSGTDYGSETRVHISVSAAVGAGDTMVLTARRPGAEGDNIATTEVGGNSSFDAGTLGTTVAGVDGDITVSVDGAAFYGVVNAPATVNAIRVLIPDEFETRGKIIQYTFEDAPAKAYADEVVVLETEDHPSAQRPNGVLYKGTATSVTSSTLVGEASEDGVAHPVSGDASLAPSLMLFIRSATVGAGQAVAVNTFTHATRTYNLLYNWPLTPTGTIVYEVFSIARMPAHVIGSVAASLDTAVFNRTFGADYETKTFEKMIEIIAAMVGGVTTGAGTTSEVFKSFTNATTEATITNDGTNRTVVTIP